uniref:Uncharacterized protein n=1 Tax=Arundo donax TaxID=35708 RepID=A0A0A9CPI5_ARUDO
MKFDEAQQHVNCSILQPITILSALTMNLHLVWQYGKTTYSSTIGLYQAHSNCSFMTQENGEAFQSFCRFFTYPYSKDLLFFLFFFITKFKVPEYGGN